MESTERGQSRCEAYDCYKEGQQPSALPTILFHLGDLISWPAPEAWSHRPTR